jgi:prepilin peptidase CpaA
MTFSRMFLQSLVAPPPPPPNKPGKWNLPHNRVGDSLIYRKGIFIKETDKMDLFLTFIIVFGMSIAALWDLKWQKIPNIFTFPMMLFGFVYHGVTSGLIGLGFSAAGFCIGIFVFLIPYLMGGMGAGDAKLMGAAGAMLGPKGVIIAAVISILFGGIYAMALLAIHHDFSRSLLRRVGISLKTLLLTGQFILIPSGKEEKKPALYYGVPIALGAMCYVYLKITGSHFIQDILGFQFTI